jgi:hypothetical protein
VSDLGEVLKRLARLEDMVMDLRELAVRPINVEFGAGFADDSPRERARKAAAMVDQAFETAGKA